MKNFLKNFKTWKDTNKFTMFIGSILSLLVIALPYSAGIIASVLFIENETAYLIISALLFVAFGANFISFTKYMNKL